MSPPPRPDPVVEDLISQINTEEEEAVPSVQDLADRLSRLEAKIDQLLQAKKRGIRRDLVLKD